MTEIEPVVIAGKVQCYGLGDHQSLGGSEGWLEVGTDLNYLGCDPEIVRGEQVFLSPINLIKKKFKKKC